MFTDFKFIGNNASFHHIGLVVNSIRSISKSVKIYFDSKQDVSVAFVNLNGIQVELIEPGSENSPISASLNNNQKLVHLCYSVKDIQKKIDELEVLEFRCISKPVSAIAFGNKKIAWLYSKIYGLIELVELE